MHNPILLTAICAVVSFFIGAIPFGLILGRVFNHTDIRKAGSGNIGTTNALRVAGPKVAALTLLLDCLKGAICVLIARPLIADLGYGFPPSIMAPGATGDWMLGVICLAAVWGHIFSPYLNFHGGKGIAVGLGVILAWYWPIGLSLLGMFIVAVAITKYVSVGSLAAAIGLPIAACAVFPYSSLGLKFCMAMIGITVVWAHSEQTAAGINGEHRNPRYLVDYVLPENVVATTDLAQALDGVEAIIFAVPSTHLRGVCHQAASFIADETPVLCLTKGIEPESGLLMSEVIASEIGNDRRVAALSGPNHAEEICRGGLSAAVIASEDPQIGETFKELLLSTAFRIYLSQDMTGVEVCGAMKNVIAIVCGISAGSGAGDNTLALIMTRGLAEISRLVHARGGQAMTCMGLAGMGDLIATCTSEHSRNRTFGYEFAHGVSLEEYQARTHMVVEGAVAARSVSELARSLGVDIPLTFAVEQTLYNGVTLDRALEILTDRVPSQEFYGLAD